MATRSVLTVPDVFMAIGLLPFAFWLALILLQVRTSGAWFVDLTTLGIAVVSGFVAYVIACLMAGGSDIWSHLRGKATDVHPSRLTKTLSIITATVVVAPWIFFALR